MSSLERAKDKVLRYLETFEEEPGLRQAVATLVKSREPEALELVAEFASADPELVPLDPLWAIAEDGGTEVPARIGALRAVTRVLMWASEDLEMELPLDDEEPIMGPEELKRHLDRVMDTYRSAEAPTELRRRALECAANVTPDAAIVAAGRAAFRSDDPDWIATGVLVVALTDHEQREAVIEEALAHDDEGVRITAIQTLSFGGDEKAVDRLERIVRTRTGDEQAAALQAMAEIPVTHAGTVLTQLGMELEGEAAALANELYEEWLEEWGAFAEDLDDFEDDDEFDDDDDFEDDELDDWDEDDDEDNDGGDGGRRR